MNKKSFTLIELLVVIAIIGILSSLVIARFSDWNDNARIANTLQWSAGVHRTLGANLVGHWPLNGDLNDISGYSDNGLWKGTDSNAPSQNWEENGVPGTGNQVLSFDGLDNFVSTDKIINFNDSMTISVWVRTFELIGLSNRAIWSIYTNNDNRMYLRYPVNGGDSSDLVVKINGEANQYYALKSEIDSLWHNIILVLSENSCFFYYDGQYISPQEGFIFSNWAGSPEFFIGSQGDVDNFFNGLISDVRIYNIALTNQEVSRMYTETKNSYLVYE